MPTLTITSYFQEVMGLINTKIAEGDTLKQAADYVLTQVKTEGRAMELVEGLPSDWLAQIWRQTTGDIRRKLLTVSPTRVVENIYLQSPDYMYNITVLIGDRWTTLGTLTKQDCKMKQSEYIKNSDNSLGWARFYGVLAEGLENGLTISQRYSSADLLRLRQETASKAADKW